MNELLLVYYKVKKSDFGMVSRAWVVKHYTYREVELLNELVLRGYIEEADRLFRIPTEPSCAVRKKQRGIIKTMLPTGRREKNYCTCAKRKGIKYNEDKTQTCIVCLKPVK